MSDHLDAASRERLVKLLGLLGSTFDGERATAAAMVSTLLRDRGLTWSDVVRPADDPAPDQYPPEDDGWRSHVAWALRHRTTLTEWEIGFLTTLQARANISERQAAVLDQVVCKVRDST